MAEPIGDMPDLLQRVAPGTALLQAFERVVQQGDGALVVLGYGPSVEAVCTGGFDLERSAFTVARLAELAKMDGAIILDDAAEWILKANVHLLPDASLPTQETGSRHRTAERVAAQTGKPAVTVSENRGTVQVFHQGQLHELESPTVLIDRVNQHLHTLERFRRRFDEAVERLDRMEVSGLTTTRHVLVVLQRAELVGRIAARAESDVVGLGGNADLVDLQLADLSAGASRVAGLVLTDYLPDGSDTAVEEAFEALASLSATDLSDPFSLANAIGLDHPDAEVAPRGVRILAMVPKLPETLQAAIADHVTSFERLIRADASELEQVDGIGSRRAMQIRRYLDRWMESTGWTSPRD